MRGFFLRVSEIEFLRVRFEWVLVFAQFERIARLRHAKPLWQAAVEEAGAFQLLEARQVADLLQAEMQQELLGRAIRNRPARRAAAAAQSYPACLEQHIERAF